MAVPYGLGLTAVKYAKHFGQMAALNVLNQQCSDQPSGPMATVGQIIQQRPQPILPNKVTAMEQISMTVRTAMGDEDDCMEYLPTHHLSAASARGLRLRHVTEDLAKKSAELPKQLRKSNNVSTGLEGATVKFGLVAVVNDTQRVLHSIPDSQTESQSENIGSTPAAAVSERWPVAIFQPVMEDPFYGWVTCDRQSKETTTVLLSHRDVREITSAS